MTFLPKAELHAHLEGTLSPALYKTLARKHNVTIPAGLLSDDQDSYAWNAHGDAGERLMSFVKTYDLAASVIKTPEDYYAITLDYLTRCANEGSIYEELTLYADPEPVVGISYAAMVDAIADAIDIARAKHGVECRLLASFVRHFGIERSISDAKTVISYPHKYVTGITMAGAETMHSVSDFVPAYRLVQDALGVQATAHAGEATGAETIRACHDLLGITRFGHMVRVVEDETLMQELAEKGATAEICLSSNIALCVYPDFESHPLRRIHDSGIKITLNSDDPPFFKTSLGREYDIARDYFGFSDEDLRGFTRNALDAAFVDDKARTALINKLT